MSSDALERNQSFVYLISIGVGLALGALTPGLGESLEVLIYPVLGALLLVTFLQVPFARLADATRDFRFLGSLLVLNFVVVPPIAWGLSQFASGTAIKIGILMVLLVPCIDYVIVFTRMAGGDATRLLASTPLLMLVQIGLLPLYLWLFMGSELAGLVEAGPFLRTFGLLILLPLGLAWAAQTLARRSPGADRLVERSVVLPVPLMAATLFVVVASQSPRVFDDPDPVASTILVFVAFFCLMTGVGLLFSRFLSRFLSRQPAARSRAILLSGVTRNGLVVLPLALALDVDSATVAAVIVTQVLVEVTALVLLVRVVPRIIPE